MALIGSITNYGSLQGEVNGYGNSLTGEITDEVTLGGEIVGMRGLKGDKGDTGDTGAAGADGHSPVVTASKTDDTTTVYVDGSPIATILDGEDGADGFSPSASVSKVGDTATITITDKDGTTTASVSDGDINVQSDWNEADTTADDYIKNKPAIPSATSTTPKMDGTAAVGSETTWAKGDHVHPTDTSRAASSHTHTKSEITDFPSLATVATSGSYTDLSSKPDIHNVPSGGTSGQVLSKGSNDDYDLAWTTVSSGGGGEIAYCTCTDSASTVAKTATLVNGSFDSLTTGAQVAVKFTYTNTATNPTLNVNNTGAKGIRRGGTTYVGTNTNESWGAGNVVILVYDGTDWQVANWLNTTYTGGTGAQIITGTEALNKVWSPQQIHDGIIGLADKNVQSDWNQSDTTADDYIKNKPTGVLIKTASKQSGTITVPANAIGSDTIDMSSVKPAGYTLIGVAGFYCVASGAPPISVSISATDTASVSFRNVTSSSVNQKITVVGLYLRDAI